MRVISIFGYLRMIVAAAAVSVMAAPAAVQAATQTWTGGGGDNHWSTAANWSGGVAPAPGDDLVFPAGAAQLTNVNDLTADFAINSITFSGGASGYSVTGNQIDLAGGLTAVISGTDSLWTPILLTASQTFDITGGRLDFNGPINVNGFNLSVAGSTGNVWFNGPVNGTGGITLSVSAATMNSSVATFNGATTVAGGTFLVLAGWPSAVSVNSGGVLQYSIGGSTGSTTADSGATIVCDSAAFSHEGRVTALTMQSGSTLRMGMDNTFTYGQLTSSGAVSLGNATLLASWNFTSSTGDAFTIIDDTSSGAVSGTFLGLPEGATFTGNGRTYGITYLGGDGNDVVITDITGLPPTPTPTPASAIPATSNGGAGVFVILLGVAGALLLRRFAS